MVLTKEVVWIICRPLQYELLFDLVSSGGCCVQALGAFHVQHVTLAWVGQLSRYPCPAAMASLHPQRFTSVFLPVACLLDNVSCMIAPHSGLPFCLHFLRRISSDLLLVNSALTTSG
ncbi:hypothetical protein MRX96_004894 [Rhipicephalus microplus]